MIKGLLGLLQQTTFGTLSDVYKNNYFYRLLLKIYSFTNDLQLTYFIECFKLTPNNFLNPVHFRLAKKMERMGKSLEAF